MENKILQIRYPNTISGSDQNIYRAADFDFKIIQKNGEMAAINWIQVLSKEGKPVAEIKESICDIYFQ